MLCSPFHKHFIQSRIRQAIFPSNRIRNSVPEFRSPSDQPAYGTLLYALIHIFCKFPLRAERKCFLIKLKAFLRNQIFIFKQRIFFVIVKIHFFKRNIGKSNSCNLQKMPQQSSHLLIKIRLLKGFPVHSVPIHFPSFNQLICKAKYMLHLFHPRLWIPQFYAFI